MTTYDDRELALVRADIARVEAAPLRERQDNAAEMLEHMRHSPALVAERVGWLLGGNYGWGAMLLARRALASRGNTQAQLCNLIAPLEWRTTAAQCRAAWLKLSQQERDTLGAALAVEISSAREEAAE